MNAEKLNVDEYLFFFMNLKVNILCQINLKLVLLRYTVPEKPEGGYPRIYCV